MQELPTLVRRIEQVSSITIGINLSGSLRPVEATIVSVGTEPFRERPLLSRMFGLETEDDQYMGISAFHSVLKSRKTMSAVEHVMFEDLKEIFEEAIKPIEEALSRYTRDFGYFIAQLDPAIRFYLSGLRLVQKLRDAGVPMCKPHIAPKEERVCEIEGLYDVNLALQMLRVENDLSEHIVTNDVRFGPDGRIFILTGPNQGGKTAYTRAIGTAQVLFQAGLYVPGKSARMSPVDWIHTHFLEEERPNKDVGTLAQECRRLATVFERASRHSLVLLNESLSSTSPGESLYLTESIVKGLRMTGCRAVFATHLHELAAKADVMNSETAGDSKIISVVAGLTSDKDDPTSQGFRTRSYRIVPGPPQGSSFALDIARRYGISLEQIIERIEKRHEAG